jgi:hypothetical protein
MMGTKDNDTCVPTCRHTTRTRRCIRRVFVQCSLGRGSGSGQLSGGFKQFRQCHRGGIHDELDVAFVHGIDKNDEPADPIQMFQPQQWQVFDKDRVVMLTNEQIIQRLFDVIEIQVYCLRATRIIGPEDADSKTRHTSSDWHSHRRHFIISRLKPKTFHHLTSQA